MRDAISQEPGSLSAAYRNVVITIEVPLLSKQGKVQWARFVLCFGLSLAGQQSFMSKVQGQGPIWT